jgi:hypothetical protein
VKTQPALGLRRSTGEEPFGSSTGRSVDQAGAALGDELGEGARETHKDTDNFLSPV